MNEPTVNPAPSGSSPASGYVPGSLVEITDGPFSGMTGLLHKHRPSSGTWEVAFRNFGLLDYAEDEFKAHNAAVSRSGEKGTDDN